MLEYSCDSAIHAIITKDIRPDAIPEAEYESFALIPDPSSLAGNYISSHHSFSIHQHPNENDARSKLQVADWYVRVKIPVWV